MVFRRIGVERDQERIKRDFTASPIQATQPGVAPATPFLSIDQAKVEELTKQLGQVTPNATTATLYTPPTGVLGIVQSIFVACPTPQTTIKVYHDDNGTSTTGTLIFIEKTAQDQLTSFVIEVDVYLADTTGAIIVESDQTDATFTAYGKETFVRKT